LVASYIRQNQTAKSKNLKEVSVEALRLLMEYTWPGNVRELQNVIEFAAIRCKGSIIQVDDLPPEVTAGPATYRTGFPDKSPLDEKERLVDALKKANGNRALAARKMGISRITLYRRMAKYGLFPSK
jgi:transcriptional regulator of acetoin/glycerol metabolism